MRRELDPSDESGRPVLSSNTGCHCAQGSHKSLDDGSLDELAGVVDHVVEDGRVPPAKTVGLDGGVWLTGAINTVERPHK